ncbi:MAG TPA: fibronectin type III domain-containing protein [Baekduia sp.]|uniref:fibronectin type III domain-containing protein n=1 Tax=Baekduia sp. TaxID=2600305 RepID=UPI002BD26B72|nr:fibronectin type III domain-containing protein [Baekduia sp.]HMJ32839.1 fibronectin type III domain-containing protein [Baekduia sp.]
MRRFLAFLLAVLSAGAVAAAVALAADPPVASTGAAKDVAQTQATLTATVDPKGAATSVRFDLGTGSSYGLQSAAKDAGAGTGATAVEIPVQGLTAGTTYHYRVVATSDGGTVTGADATFSTATAPPTPARPAVTTGAVRGVTPTGATLTGSLTPHSAATTYRFEYGTTTRYGAGTPATAAGSGTRGVGASARIEGLSAGTRYHYRLTASNAVGSTTGGDRSFVAGTTPTSATLAADADPVTYGRPVKLTGKLGGSKKGGVRVRLQTTAFPFAAPFTDIGNALKSSSSGAYTFTLPAVTTTTRAVVVADGVPSIVSSVVVVRSAVRSGIRSLSRRADGSVVVTGRLTPATPNGVAALQRQGTGGRWLPLRRANAKADGSYTITLRPRRNAMVVRAVGLAHDGGAHVRGYSRSVKIAARRR